MLNNISRYTCDVTDCDVTQEIPYHPHNVDGGPEDWAYLHYKFGGEITTHIICDFHRKALNSLLWPKHT